ncbi:fimbria/pilus outer membrane usher protein [Pseudomonas sp. H9]|uniref:fimbria/pilus outer membrane usher protein n=1 Tax=Pseudomonas sp. H9 TaxID=483968 RepID=UPI00105772EC|nr:fimbria/pilus outer membrane usher protein [Pseudomonas sp. H9]TDF81592.1 fimbrial biogenesis outer membrane usher protein [Pseudomonas sp. H9]
MIKFFAAPAGPAAGAVLCLATAMAGNAALAATAAFDARFLHAGGAPAVDVSRFQHADSVPEGDQVLDIVINEQWKGRWLVPLRLQGDALRASPCYSDALLQALAIDRAQLAASVRRQLQPADSCLPLSALGIEASEALDYAGLRLTLQVAQQALLPIPLDYLPEEQWDSGTHAAFVDYRFNLYKQQSLADGQHWQQSFLGLRSGVNTGAWYWRHEGNLQVGDGIEQRYQPIASYVQRDVAAWNAQLTLGESYSRGAVFDSIAYRGLGLASDERMLPASQRGYAPTVSGVAHSTSLLTIRQRGVLVHESTVQPGPFEISDLYANSFSDDLEVTLKEADGNLRTFSVPYQAAPLALRPGARRFDFSLGRWRDSLGNTGVEHLQGSWQQGLSNRFSVHAGLISAQGYQSAALGGTLNSRLGAVALTVLGSQTDSVQQGPIAGHALRMNWRHVLAASATDLSASLTRSRPDFEGFNEFARARVDAGHGRGSQQNARLSARFALSQGLGEQGGRLALQVSQTQRWRQSGSDVGYSFGYFNRYGALGYGVTANREQSAATGHRNHFALTLSLPLGEGSRSSLSSSLNSDGKGRSATSTRISGAAGEHGQWGYGLGLTTSHDEQRNSAGADANVRYSGPGAEISGSLSQQRDYRLASVGAQGALVAHAGGLTAAQSLGESFAIVHAPGAARARLKQAPQVQLDSAGYGVLPQLLPYSLNTVELDPKGTSHEVELQLSSLQVIPRAGAAALLYYPTRSGRSALIDARLADGSVLPFGASVVDESGDELGLVGQGSRLHVRGVRQQGRLQVRWGEDAQQQCALAYRLPETSPANNVATLIHATCEPLQNVAGESGL